MSFPAREVARRLQTFGKALRKNDTRAAANALFQMGSTRIAAVHHHGRGKRFRNIEESLDAFVLSERDRVKHLVIAAAKFFEDCRTACLAIKALLETGIKHEDWKFVRTAVEEVLGELLGWQDAYRTMFLSKLAQPYKMRFTNQRLSAESIAALTTQFEKLASDLQRIFVAAAFEALTVVVSQHDSIPMNDAAAQVEERIKTATSKATSDLRPIVSEPDDSENAEDTRDSESESDDGTKEEARGLEMATNGDNALRDEEPTPELQSDEITTEQSPASEGSASDVPSGRDDAGENIASRDSCRLIRNICCHCC